MKYFVTVLLLITSASVSFSQTTLTESDLTAFVGTVFSQQSFSDTNDDAAITALVNKTGAGQTWDLSALTNYNSSGSGTFSMQAGTAGVPDGGVSAFQSATHVIKVLALTGLSANVYNFIIVSPTSYQDIGSLTSNNGTNSTITYTPPVTVYPFPLQYGSKWASNPMENLSGQSYQQNISDEVDGEGTLIIPAGHSAKVLRVKETTITSYAPGFGDTSTTYRFVDPSGTMNGTLSAPITKLLGGVIPYTIKGSATYSFRTSGATGSVNGNQKNSFNLDQNYPNPTSALTAIHFVTGNSLPIRYSIRDVLGRTVQSEELGVLPIGDHTFTIDCSKMPIGTYFYTVENGVDKATTQIVVSK